jgi:hypothetical protein
LGVILADLGNREHDIQVNWWTWRPTAQLIGRVLRLRPDVVERLQVNGAGARISRKQARRVATYLRRQLLPAMVPDSRLLLDGEVITQPQPPTVEYTADGPVAVDKDGQSARPLTDEEEFALWSATPSWLGEFASFCESSSGFVVH